MTIDPRRRPVLHTKKHIARLERERRQSRLILFSFFGILLAVVALLVYGYLDINYLQLRRAVAKVNGVAITDADLEARVRLQRQSMLYNLIVYQQYQQFGLDTSQQIAGIQQSLADPQGLGQSVLDNMINEELIRQEAAKRGITVSAAAIEKKMHEQQQYFPDGTNTPTVTPTTVVTPTIPASAYLIVSITPTATATSIYTSTPTITPTLAPGTGTATPTVTSTPTQTSIPTLADEKSPTPSPTETITPTATAYTLKGYQTKYSEALASFSKLGFTEQAYRQYVETQLLQDKLKAIISADVKTTQDEVWARHILVPDEVTAKALIERLKAGEDFALLAKQFSKDGGSAAIGGDVGWFAQNGQMVPEFETAAFALKNPGDFTLEPVKSQYGYHIIQLIARQVKPLDANALDQARTTAFTDWLTKLHDQYKIENFDFWKSRVPTDPNATTIAQDAADAAATRNAASPTP